MTTETEIETGLKLLFEERSEDPCEHSEHGSREAMHSGPGEWLLEGRASCCGGDWRHILVCDKFKRRIMDSGMLIDCTKCGTEGIAPEEWYTVLGRKGVDF